MAVANGTAKRVRPTFWNVMVVLRKITLTYRLFICGTNLNDKVLH